MDLAGYELLELTIQGGIQVSTVRQESSGRVFQIHAFHGDSLAEFDRLCGQLAAIPPRVSRVVETGREPGSGFIRTEPLPEGVGILGWTAVLRMAPDDTETDRVFRLALQLRMQSRHGRKS
jgi:hypothetical protein